MNITLKNYTPSAITFGSNHKEKLFDDIEAFDDYKIIPEYDGIQEVIPEDDERPDIFREYELFDRRKDSCDSHYYHRYGDPEDVQLADKIIYRSIPADSRHFSSYIDTDIRNYERELPEQSNYINTIYTVENSWKSKHESFQERLNQGFKRSDISNIYHFALINTGIEDKKRMDLNLAQKGFELLSSGKSIYETADIMDKSKIHYANGSTRFDADLFNLLAVYPDCRDVVVTRSNIYESVRKDVIEVYPAIHDVCPDNEDAKLVIKACQTSKNYQKEINKEALDACLNAIKNGEERKNATKLISESKIYTGNGDNKFNRNLYEFLIENPTERDLVVDSHNGIERFNEETANAFNEAKKVCPKDDAALIVEACKTTKWGEKAVDTKLLDSSLNLVKEGKPVKQMIKAINDSYLRQDNREKYFNSDLFCFLLDNPDSREDVVETSYRTEYFRDDIAKELPKIKKACENKEAIPDILEVCRVQNGRYGKSIDHKLLRLAKNLLDVDPEWRDEHTKIMKEAKKRPRYLEPDQDSEKYCLATAMAKTGYSINSIYSTVVLNNQNIELLKK